MSEATYINTMIDHFGTGGKTFAMVGDTYNIFEFCELLGTDSEIKQKIVDNGNLGGFVVVRPDSGDPATVVKQCLQILEKYFGSTKNDKGYKVLNNVRVLQGDGINHASIRSILYIITLAGYSADNVVFGQGGMLLQTVNRDDQKFALKASYGIINGEEVLIRKDPITDPGKRSKVGKMKLIQQNGKYETINHLDPRYPDAVDILQVVFENGSLVNETTFEEVRKRASL